MSSLYNTHWSKYLCYMNTHICNHMYYVIIFWVGQKCQYMKLIQFLISSDFNIYVHRLNTYIHLFHVFSLDSSLIRRLSAGLKLFTWWFYHLIDVTVGQFVYSATLQVRILCLFTINSNKNGHMFLSASSCSWLAAHTRLLCTVLSVWRTIFKGLSLHLHTLQIMRSLGSCHFSSLHKVIFCLFIKMCTKQLVTSACGLSFTYLLITLASCCNSDC